ncbi:N-acetylmuramoyl-L-alanine amidase [Muricoccus radiodurans]|uniref:N-acetylmuramoyl-L-alanine amidase n=1 Tax=Muricoccus radiodurans TaxID=2231721 RepID=UPI003CEDDA1E
MSVFDDIRDVARRAAYAAALPNLLLFKSKPSKSFASRGNTKIDEIILHGTESKGTEEQSASYVASAANSSHYFIGRTFGVAYSVVPEEMQAFHAGNPKRHPGVQDHNARSIGIEMYQRDISMFGGDASKLDWTDWQYETIAMLVYDIRRRRGIAADHVKGHVQVNSVDRADPRRFDWVRHNRRVTELSRTLGRLLGPGFAIDLDLPSPRILLP